MPSVDLEHRDSFQRYMKKQNYSTSSKLELEVDISLPSHN